MHFCNFFIHFTKGEVIKAIKLKNGKTMYINTYTPMPLHEVKQNIKEYKANLDMLLMLQAKGFKTINDAFRTVVKKQITKRELTKFCKLLHPDAEYFQRYEGYTVYLSAPNYKENINLLQFYLTYDGNIGRHYTGGSLNLDSHTIEELIKTCMGNIQKYVSGLNLHDSIESRIKDYEDELAETVKTLYLKHIEAVASVVYLRSI